MSLPLQTPRRNPRWWGGGVALGLLFLLASPSGASASLDGPCEARGTFTEGGFTIDAKTAGGKAITVPRADTVFWEGSVATAANERQISGYVAVDLPPPFGRVTIDSWGGNAIATSNEGVDEYDLGNWIPGGIDFRVFGEHQDEGGVSCSGEVTVRVEGGAFTSPVTPISLALTAASGAGFFGLIRPLFRRGF